MNGIDVRSLMMQSNSEPRLAVCVVTNPEALVLQAMTIR